MIKKLWFYAKLIWRDEPVRSWRKLDNGKYMCDGDCGRWHLHGVCTCGLCHFFKITSTPHSKIERDNESWHREGQTEQVMQTVPYENECSHGVSWNDICQTCERERDDFLKEMGFSCK